MLQTITPIYTRPTPPPVVLCAWVRNPDTSQEAIKPNYIRAEIIAVNGDEIIVTEYGKINYFMTTRANVHKVHTVNAFTGETWQVFGEPKPC